MPLFYSIPPTSNPIDLSEVKDHLRITGADYDNELQMLIDAMTDTEDINNPAQFGYKRQFIKATLVFTLSKVPQKENRRFCWPPEFPGSNFIQKIELPRPPLISVISVEFRDETGVFQPVDIANYEVNTDADPGFIRFLSDFEFPDFFTDEEFPIKITYTAGYQDNLGVSTFAQVPANARVWIMNHIGNYFTERKSDLITNMNVVELKAAMGRLMAPHNAARRFG